MDQLQGREYSAREQRNLELVAAMYEAVLKPLDSSQVDRFIAPDYLQHSMAEHWDVIQEIDPSIADPASLF